jgi:hypothetical protein
MQTISGLFDTYEHATAAVHALHEAGIAHADISLVSATPPDFDYDPVDEGATTGAEVGAGLGAAGGLLAGLGILTIPGFGPVVATGWLFATAIGSLAGAGIGAATGGLVGTLTSAGHSEVEAHELAERVRSGGAIVTARVDETHAGPAAAILRHAAGISAEGASVEAEVELEAEHVEVLERGEVLRREDKPFVPPVV